MSAKPPRLNLAIDLLPGLTLRCAWGLYYQSYDLQRLKVMFGAMRPPSRPFFASRWRRPSSLNPPSAATRPGCRCRSVRSA